MFNKEFEKINKKRYETGDLKLRILGIDYGTSRIGVAISDPFGWIAQPLETIDWKGNINCPVERIMSIVDEYKVGKIIVGYPKNMNGTLGESAAKTDKFIKHLAKKACNLEIIKWDERLSTVAANRILNESGVKATVKSKAIDSLAATYILQGYLDRLKNEEAKINESKESIE